MTREQFIRLYADACAKGRKKCNPDIRPSEMVMARMEDERQAARIWGKQSRELEGYGVEEFKTDADAYIKTLRPVSERVTSDTHRQSKNR